MHLAIFLEGKELSSIPLDADKASRPDYVQAKRRLLRTVHHQVLQTSEEPPVYYIQVSAKLNK